MSSRYPGVYPYATRGGRLYRVEARRHGVAISKRGFPSEREAAEWLEAEASKLGQGYSSGSATTLQQFVEQSWFPRLDAKERRGELQPETVAGYKRAARLYVLPAFGARRLGDIRPEEVERFGDRLSSAGLSSDYARAAVLVLGYALKLARRWRLILYNPVAEADKPRPRRRRPDLPTLSDVRRLAAAMPTREARALVLFAAETGARKSECFALRWENVDLSEGAERVRIVEQFYKGSLKPSPKTEAGRREIVLAPQTAAVLRELSVAQQVEGLFNPHLLVFPAPGGGRWLDTNFDRRLWRPAREAAGLPSLTFHVLRYFYVSHVRAQGLPTAVTQQLVGHADDRTHVGYTRPVPGSEASIRAALGRAFDAAGAPG